MTFHMSVQHLEESLRKFLPESLVKSDNSGVWVKAESLVQICNYLKNDPLQDYKLLNSLTAVDYIEFFDVVYHLTSLTHKRMTVLKVRVYGRGELIVPSVNKIWKGATLQEREVWDLLGITFSDHPNLSRILTWEGFKGHALRRDYLEPPLPYTWPHGG
ncbi:MAG: NADH-quinone oxidoreductase subunit C [SAR202 cluster bacterium]|nr:NADH-quinone oxidoreductase subunit C [SAR202 cluster bacterium]|tara:strand:- start:47000 stop:47476 length:477 start_codon:yes stop_codon:yes gene_type:complete